MTHPVLTALWIAADNFASGTLMADEVPRDTGPDFGKASPMGLLIIVLLLLGTFGLVWSMNRQLKKLPESFDPQEPTAQDASGQGPDDPV